MDSDPSTGLPLLVKDEFENVYDRRAVVILTLFSSLGGFLFGYDTGVVSGAMVLIAPRFQLSHHQQEAVVSITVLGAILGSPLGGVIAQKWGRRTGIMLFAMVFLIASLALASAMSLVDLLIWRFWIGLAVGAAASIIPMYLSECAPSSIRGRIVATYNMFVNFGQFGASIVDGLLVGVPGGWRYMLGLAAVPALLQLPGFAFLLHESPRWLINQGRDREAIDSVQFIFGSTKDVDKYLKDLREANEVVASAPQFSISHLWRQQEIRKALYIGCFLQLIQQASGINTVMYYTGTLMTMTGYSAENAVWINAAVAGFNFLFAFVGVYLMDRLGRREVTLYSLGGITASLGMIALSFVIMEIHSHWNALPIVGLCSYLACFASGMGPIPWVVNSELYPMHVRSTAVSVATSVNWTSNLVISASFLSLVDSIGRAGAFSLYGAIALFGWLILFKNMPETKGKTLEEIQTVLRGS